MAEALIAPPLEITISEPVVGPSLRNVIWAPMREAVAPIEILPEAVLVLPVPSRKWNSISPSPAWTITLSAIPIRALPASL